MSASRLVGLDHGERVALLVNECQHGILDPGSSTLSVLADQAAARDIVAAILPVAQAIRSLGAPVIHLTTAHRPAAPGWRANYPLAAMGAKRPAIPEGSRGATPVDELLDPADQVVTRFHGVTAFSTTDLDARLRAAQIQTVVLVGVATDLGILGNAIEAVNRGYFVVVPEDCLAGTSYLRHEAVIDHQLHLLSSVTTARAVLDQLTARVGAAQSPQG